MKNIKYILLSLIIFTSTIFAIEFTNDEKEYLKSHLVIKVHNETHWAPFNFNIDGVAQGFSIDYMNLLASKIGVKVEYISGYSWNEYMGMLQSDKLDVIINIAYTKQRAKTINFTQPFYAIQNVIYVNKNNPNFYSLDDLKGYTIASVKDFFIQQELEKDRPNIKQIIVEDQIDTLKLLSLGKVDAVIAEKAVVDYIIQNSAIPNIISTNFIEETKYISKLRLGTSRQDIVLIDILGKAQKLVTTQEMNLLKQKWFGIEEVNKNGFTKSEKQYIKEKHIIKVCTNPNWTPIEFTKDENPRGISIDTLNIIGEKLNLKYDFITTSSWSESQKFLKEKKCDILPSAIKTTKRLKYANFTNPYLHYDLAIVTKDDKPLVQNIQSVINKSMARKKGSGLIGKLKAKYPNINILETKGYQEAFQSVASGDVYFTIATLPVLAYYKNKFNLDRLQIAGYTKMKYDLRIAVRNDDVMLLNILNKALNKIDAKTHNIIYEKWTTKQVEFKTDYSLVWKIIIAVGLFILIMSYYQIKMRKNNIELKKVKKELEQLNNNLEFKIADEVEKNRQKEQQLFQQSRLAQMGEMLSMIAHQWRQPLAAISSTSSGMNLKAQLNKLDNDTAIYLTTKISNYSQHLSSTIDDFRDFFKPNKEKKEIKYDEIITSVLNIVETSIVNQNIKLVKKLQSKDVFNTHPNEIKQVLLNLLKNAEDILIENNIQNPTITIQTQNGILTVSDNGGGIPKDIMPNIFDPYFSTKTKKDGTGLGLYMSKIIIEEHCGGELSVSNDENGAVFSIKLGLNNE